MTAMSDVTVLLLTFFMLTSTFLQKEPVTVITPSSVSEEKVPVSDLATVLVSPTGKVFLSILGDADPESKDTFGSEAVRKSIAMTAIADWNDTHSQKVNLTEAQLTAFSKMNMFGVPFQVLPKFLSMKQTEQDKFMQQLDSPQVGIPVSADATADNPDQFSIWLKAIRKVTAENDKFKDAIKSGEGITVKADRGTPYQFVHPVLNDLQNLKLNRFTIMTALKTAED